MFSAPPARAGTFAGFWMGGYEGADHINGTGTPLDMVRASGHLDRLEEDHRRAAQTGLRCVRESIGWRLCEDAGGAIDLSRAVRVQASARQHGLQVLWTLMHYGLPPDLCLHDDALIARLARFAAEVVRVLAPGSPRPLVVTPVNEISFLAWAAAQPEIFQAPNNTPADAPGAAPGSSRVSGYRVKRRLAQASLAAMAAMRQREPRTRFLHVDPLIHVVAPAGQPGSAPEAEQVCQWQWQANDLLAGRLEPELGGGPEWLDIVGFNHYHCSQWELGTEARLDWASRDPRRRPVSQLMRDAWRRYGRPLVVAETGHVGVGRADWLHQMADEVRRARHAGVPVLGLCLYPLVDRPDWHQPQHWHRSGLWHVHVDGAAPPSPSAAGEGPPGRDGRPVGSVPPSPFAREGPEALHRPARRPPLTRCAEPVVLAALQAWQRVLPGPQHHDGAEATPHRDGQEATPGNRDGEEATPRHRAGEETAPAYRDGEEATPAHRDAAEATPAHRRGRRAASGVAPASLSDRPVLLAFSHRRWDCAVRHRQRHLLERLSVGWRVVYVEEPLFDPGPPRLECFAAGPCIDVLVPRTPRARGGCPTVPRMGEPPLRAPGPASSPDLQVQLHDWLECHGIRRPLAWLNTPMAWPLARSLDPRAVVVDGVDGAGPLPAVPLRQALQSSLLASADLVFVADPAAADPAVAVPAVAVPAVPGDPAVAGAGPSASRSRRVWLPNGVDSGFFGTRHRLPFGWDAEEAARLALPADGPQLGYAGVVDERVDLALLAALADARPQWQFVLLGPVLRVDPRSLPRRPNLHWLGPQPHRLLPLLLARWRVALLPLRCPLEGPGQGDPLGMLEVLEALAAGLPVVATAAVEVARWRHAGVRVVRRSSTEPKPLGAASDCNNFLLACEDSLTETPMGAALRRGAARHALRTRQWSAVAHFAEKALADLIARPPVAGPSDGVGADSQRIVRACKSSLDARR